MRNDESRQRLSRIASADLIADAAAIADFTFKRPEFDSAANVSGVRNKRLTFSRRNDSRTIFASDGQYGLLGRAGAWTGSDRTVTAACRRVLRAARVPAREIAGIDVLSEMGQVAERVSGDEVRVGPPTLLRKVARARREVNGVPVWSSYATLGLTSDGHVGRLEVHWPDLPEAVVEEGAFLQKLAGRRVELPKVAGARPEAVEAGIIHSPAIAFFMDVAAALRVVYRAMTRGWGGSRRCTSTATADRSSGPATSIRPGRMAPAARCRIKRRNPWSLARPMLTPHRKRASP